MGHDFRPDYLHIAQARAALGNPLTAALTATATPQVQKDIIRLLGLGDDAVKPLTLREWNPLARKLQAASLRPSDLPQQSKPGLQNVLSTAYQAIS